jgi:hypothetical protein
LGGHTPDGHGPGLPRGRALNDDEVLVAGGWYRWTAGANFTAATERFTFIDWPPWP